MSKKGTKKAKKVNFVGGGRDMATGERREDIPKNDAYMLQVCFAGIMMPFRLDPIEGEKLHAEAKRQGKTMADLIDAVLVKESGKGRKETSKAELKSWCRQQPTLDGETTCQSVSHWLVNHVIDPIGKRK